ncbi:hypothetical protein [Amycolatopsis sp. NPDC051716]|uniref:hypothetical protein n=1 Tax=Amycolatopsis sp. NPDC051716 TaxID=3155804 RepID=UPI003421355B
MRLTWTIQHHGWALCFVEDEHAGAEAFASYVTDGPEQLLKAVARVILHETHTKAEFEAEPTVYRWFFHRGTNTVTIRLLEAADRKTPEHEGKLLWQSEQPTTTLAKTVLRAFDTLSDDLGETVYQTRWGRPFPRHDLEGLRTAWRRACVQLCELASRRSVIHRTKVST